MVAEAPRRNLTVSDPLRHVDSMAVLPSGAGKIDHWNTVIPGEALSSEENDLVCPSEDFSRQALVSSLENRISREALILTVRKQLGMAVGWVLRSDLLKVERKKSLSREILAWANQTVLLGGERLSKNARIQMVDLPGTGREDGH